MTSRTGMLGTNDIKNNVFEILLAGNIVHTKDNKIGIKHSQN